MFLNITIFLNFLNNYKYVNKNQQELDKREHGTPCVHGDCWQRPLPLHLYSNALLN